MSAKPLTPEEILTWEKGQEERFEFDGIQPLAVTGASYEHAALIFRLTMAPGARLNPYACRCRRT
jgi:hypothetical protein